MKYLVLIGDIVSSRQIVQRELTQDKLNSVLVKVSQENPWLVSPYTITLGDEFQAVFSKADFVFSETMEILAAVYPQKVRFSFGVGEISTKINHDEALGMDGPAFHYARDGMDLLKKSGNLFMVNGLSDICNGLIQESLYMVSYTCRNWNFNRLRAFVSCFKNEEIQTVADELHITDKAIYKTISAGNLQNIFRLLNEITRIINERLV